MKNRFSSMGKSLLGAMCLLSTCGLTYSCSDDYDLDETMPSFLGGSIYDELKARDFNTVVRLIDDLDYKDVLSRTGSKTLFVATDEAYKGFFENQTVFKKADGQYVRSYDELSDAQKRKLLYNAMLNNADVLEMLPYSAGGGSLTMRRETAATAVDSVTYWNWADLPENLNIPGVDADNQPTGDKRFWDKYRNGQKNIYMALDASKPMMLHFIEDQMKVQDITHEDVSFLLNNKNPWANGSAGGKRTYVYDAMVKSDGQDVTCLNGYFNILDTVLLTPPNMAEVIRTNGKTDLFSAMLDRFSAPYYNAQLTADYKSLYDIGTDSVFEKRYLSMRSATGAISQDPDKKSLGSYPLLRYDPGWNEYATNAGTPKEQDMGAMFVPTDAAMTEYFLNGGGKVLLDRYADKNQLPVTADNLKYHLYQIPLDIMQALINNLMMDSFIETVPSKYLTITNDAQDQMFPASNPDYASETAYKAYFDECLLANNGVVYVMNRVMTPADYASVMAPALFQENTQVIRSIVRGDDNFIEDGYDISPLQRYYSTYLKAMQSYFSFFVPTDDGLSTYGYVDPMSLARGMAQSTYFRYWRFSYKSTNVNGPVLPIRAEAYVYNPATGQDPTIDRKGYSPYTCEPNEYVRTVSTGTSTKNGRVKRTLLMDLIDQHIVVHEFEGEAENKMGVNTDRTYFISRGGAPVYISSKGDASNNNKDMVVNGGFQVQLKSDDNADNDHECVVERGFDMTKETNGYGNGRTYIIDRPMQPTTNTVYAVLNKDQAHYGAFFTLCKDAEFTDNELTLAGFRTEEMDEDEKTEEAKLWAAEKNKFKIFKGEENGTYPPYDEMLVRFFNNYRYTIYVPTDAAVDAARQNGLMTRDEIALWIEEHKNEEGVLSLDDQQKAQAMILTLMNFLKYHFQDETIYVDNVEAEQAKYQTACIDNESNMYLTITAKLDRGTLKVTDLNNNVQEVQAPYNVMARDIAFKEAPRSIASEIKSSSFVVLHQVNQVLNFKKLTNGRYDDVWKDSDTAKAFNQKYKLR